MKAISKASASGIVRKIKFDPKVYQKIFWQWKIMSPLKKGDARKKEGDDYPARIYITFEYDPDKVSLWERTNFYKRLFGKEPPRVSGIAMMTDTDNTGESTEAYYADIVLRPAE